MNPALCLLALTLAGLDKEPTAASHKPADAPECCEVWRMSLADAVRIGLDNSELVRVISLGAEGAPAGGCCPPSDRPKASAATKISPINADTDPWRFKAEVTAEVRSIEQQYWSLAQQHVQLWSSEKAVELAEEILKREQSELEVGRGTVADVAEAQQRLEQFRLDLVTKTSDVVTTERQLRNLLGLPPRDHRRIVPTSVATEAKVEPVWDECLAAMLREQPDILHVREQVLQVAGLEGEPTMDPILLAANLATEKGASPKLVKALAFYKQVVQQTTHSLARFFLEIDANYKQYQAALKFRAAAAQRLEAQRAFYEEGRVTIDRYLDAVSRHASAVAQEAQFKTSYNISIIALEEAKGTLLAYDGIEVLKAPCAPSGKAVTAVKAAAPCPPKIADDAVKTASHEAPGPIRVKAGSCFPDVVAPAVAEPAAAPCAGKASCPASSTTGARTLTFEFTVGTARPVAVRGSVTISPAADGTP